MTEKTRAGEEALTKDAAAQESGVVLETSEEAGVGDDKVKELLEKDAKTARAVTGPWQWLVAGLGAFMVVFYFYTAGVSSVSTQYHRGVYVFITYVLVFLLYPAPRETMRALLSVFGGFVVASAVAAFAFFDDVASFHDRLTSIGVAWSDSGLGAALGQAAGLWPLFLAALALGAGLFVADRKMASRWPVNPTSIDVLMAVISASVVYYWIHEFEDLNYRAGAETELDALVSIVGIVLSLEVCRRVLGWAMTSVGLVMLAYAYFGAYLPDIVAHRGFGVERLATALFITTNGVFGVMANVLATYVILFIFFGAFLHKSGAGKFFIDLPMAIAGKSTGGPAKVAVMASALFGSVSGSAIANTVSTGAFTIPLMKRAGFRPHVAGAIEPSASIGGMFMPPIMGAGGFLMAELTETPYVHIMLIAIFPALLYFFSVFCMIHFEAKKHKIEGVVGEDLPHWTVVLRREWYFSMPLVIITVLMILGRSPGFSAFWATLSCIAISWFRKETRMGPKEIWEAIQTGARNTLIIGATLGVIGVIVGTISLTGIGLKFSDIIISLAGGHLLPAILLVGLASLVLGMGVPVTAAYLITAVLAVPPLAEMGVVLIAAHMIVYWFSQDSNITPPVCVAAYAGAAIAGADPWKTGWTAFKFAKLLYVMPVLFAFTPAILFEGKPLVAPPMQDELMGGMVMEIKVAVGDAVEEGDVVATVLDGEEIREIGADRDGVIKEILISGGGFLEGGALIAETAARPSKIFSSMFSAFLGTIAFSALTMGFLLRRTNILEWPVLAVATVLLYWPTFTTDAAGLVLVTAVFLSQKWRAADPPTGARPLQSPIAAICLSNVNNVRKPTTHGGQVMKRNPVVWTLVTLLLLVLGATAAQAGAKLKINANAEIDLGFRLQVLGIFTERDIDGDGEHEAFDDFRLRRARFRLKGTVNKHISMFLQTDVSGNDIRMVDAYIHLKKNARFQVFLGQHHVGANRQNVTSSGTLLALDRPGLIYKSLTWGTRALTTFDTSTYSDSDAGFRGPAQVRDTGVTFWGTGDMGGNAHYKYYLGTYDGISASGHDSERYTGRLQLNFGDAEPSYYSVANYLGKKNTIGVGFSYDTQSDVASSKTPLTDYNFYSVDLFASQGAATFEGAFMNLDLDGANPAAEGDGFYAQLGYLMSNNKMQPWFLYEDWSAEEASGKGSYDLWRVGLSYFMAGHNANFKIGYESMSADALIGSSNEDQIDSFVIGFYTTY